VSAKSALGWALRWSKPAMPSVLKRVKAVSFMTPSARIDPGTVVKAVSLEIRATVTKLRD
jgi:hypothetical protein